MDNAIIKVIPEKKRQLVLKELQLIEQKEGSLTPAQVVDFARSDKSSLHDLFEWNNTVAGEKYRLWQSRFLIGSMKIELQGRSVKAFESIQMSVEYQDRSYVSTERVLSNKEMKKQVLNRAVSEIRYWQNKFNSLSELSGVVNEDKLKNIEKKIK